MVPLRAKTFLIETHGCLMNEHDSEKISGLLAQQGLLPVHSLAEADLFILNTCSVREKAAQKVYSRLGEVKRRKKEHPDFRIAVVGCVAQQESEEMVKRAPQVDLVVGTHQYHTLPDLLGELERNPRAAVHTGFLPEIVDWGGPSANRSTDFRANVTIMEGCNKRCAFCVVPYTRGKERNRPAKEILGEIKEAALHGYVEIVLLGQTVNSYKDPDSRHYGFAQLLGDVAAIEGLRRIRFTSPHPRNFGPDVIHVIAAKENICNQVHLPVQSGSSRILKRMRRQHDREWFLELVEQFRSSGRQIALSTDVIVGFPGESEEDFEQTLSLVKEVQFEQMFSFKYSVRPNTEAEAWKDDVPEVVKTERLRKLQHAQRLIQLQLFEERYLGRVFEVLVEGTAKDGHRRFGRTASNRTVNYEGSERPGEFVKVKITDFSPNSLLGEKVSALESAG